VVQGFPQRRFFSYPLQQDSDTIEAIYLQWLVAHLRAMGRIPK
jgi:hypothetical protein